jgi:hypothetical protein
MKLNNFCTRKEMISKFKRPPIECEKNLHYLPSDKGLITRIYRGLKKLNSLKISDSIKKWATFLPTMGKSMEAP